MKEEIAGKYLVKHQQRHSPISSKEKSPLEKLRYNSDHPMGTEQPNPHPNILHKQFERLRQMNIIDPTMKISHNKVAPSGINNGADCKFFRRCCIWR